MLRQRLFCLIGRIAQFMPLVWGRTRPFLMLFNILALNKVSTFVEAQMSTPVRYKVRLDLRSWLQRIAFLTGNYESDTVQFLRKLQSAHPNPGHFFDIGANIGLISIPFSRLQQLDGLDRKVYRVYSFEAVTSNQDALKHNIELNQLEDTVFPVPVALGDCVKTIQIQVEGDLHAGEGSGTANILADDSTYECVRISLHLQTLDELIGRNEIPSTASVIKIDTDGYDLKVFEGGRSFLKTARPVIFGEFSAHCMNWHHQTVSDVVSFANELNYVVWRKSGKDWRFSEKIDHKNYVQDLLMIPIEYVTQYAWCLQPNTTALQT